MNLLRGSRKTHFIPTFTFQNFLTTPMILSIFADEPIRLTPVVARQSPIDRLKVTSGARILEQATRLHLQLAVRYAAPMQLHIFQNRQTGCSLNYKPVSYVLEMKSVGGFGQVTRLRFERRIYATHLDVNVKQMFLSLACKGRARTLDFCFCLTIFSFHFQGL